MIILTLLVISYVALVLDSGGGIWSVSAAALPQFLYLAAALAVQCVRGAGAILWAAAAGLGADVVQGVPLGLNVVLLANLAFGCQMLGVQWTRQSAIVSSAFILLYVTVAGVGSLTMPVLLSSQLPPFGECGMTALSRAGGTVVVYLAFLMLGRTLLRLVRRIAPRPAIAGNRPRWAQ